MYQEYNEARAREEAEAAGELGFAVVDGRVTGAGALQEQIDAVTHRVAQLEGICGEQLYSLQEQISHGNTDLHVRMLALENRQWFK